MGCTRMNIRRRPRCSRSSRHRMHMASTTDGHEANIHRMSAFVRGPFAAQRPCAGRDWNRARRHALLQPCRDDHGCGAAWRGDDRAARPFVRNALTGKSWARRTTRTGPPSLRDARDTVGRGRPLWATRKRGKPRHLRGLCPIRPSLKLNGTRNIHSGKQLPVANDSQKAMRET